MLKFVIRFGKSGQIAAIILLAVLGSCTSALCKDDAYSFVVTYAYFFLMLAVVFIPRWELRRIDRILNDRCDAAAYLIKTDALVSLAEKRPNNTDLSGLLYRKALALSYLGRWQEAKQLYEAVRAFPIQSASLAMFLNADMVTISLVENDLPAAQMYLQGEINCMGMLRERELVKIPANAHIQISQATILDYQKDYAQAKALFLEAEAVISTYKQSLCSKVGLSFAIGRTDYNMGNYAEAVPRLQFAADNGGTTFYRTRAKEMLAQIGNTNFN